MRLLLAAFLLAIGVLGAIVRGQQGPAAPAPRLIKEFNWGSGPAAGNLAGMMQELR